MQLRHQDWRLELEHTHYPFSPAAKLRNAAGVELEPDTFVDARLHAVGGRERAFLSRVVVDHAEIVLHVGDAGGPSRSSGRFALPTPPDLVRLVDDHGRPAGVLVSEANRLARLQSWGLGTHEFRVADTEFAVAVQSPLPEIGVRGLLLDDGTLVTGRARIVAEDGIVLRRFRYELPTANGQPQVVDALRVDVVGDPLFRRRLCSPEDLFVTPRPIRTVRVVADNGSFECGPDVFGRLTLQGNDSLVADPALRVRETANGLLIEVVGSSISGDR